MERLPVHGDRTVFDATVKTLWERRNNHLEGLKEIYRRQEKATCLLPHDWSIITRLENDINSLKQTISVALDK